MVATVDDEVGEWVAARLGWIEAQGTLQHNDRW